jgi:hypothetical protein
MTTVIAPRKPSLRRPDGRRLVAEQDEGPSTLEGWHASGVELTFVYTRSRGGLMQSGRCRIESLTDEFLKLEAGDCKLVVCITDAGFDVGPQLFFSANLLSRADIHGVALKLANFDWLFLAEATLPEGASLPALTN